MSLSTTVFGAGFSIDSHFHCFHALFLTGVLTFERKSDSSSLARLRLLAEVSAPDPDRQS